MPKLLRARASEDPAEESKIRKLTQAHCLPLFGVRGYLQSLLRHHLREEALVPLAGCVALTWDSQRRAEHEPGLGA